MPRSIRSEYVMRQYVSKRVLIVRGTNWLRRIRRGTRALISHRQVSRLYDSGDPKDRVSRHSYRYWSRKVHDPGFHPLRHGGRRAGTFKLTQLESALVDRVLHSGFRRRPDRNLISVARSITNLINDYLRPRTNATFVMLNLQPMPNAVLFTVRDLRRIFHRWGWTLKVPIRFQLNKFRPENILRYINYAVAVTWVDPRRLKFLDEASYCARGPFTLVLFLPLFLTVFE